MKGLIFSFTVGAVAGILAYNKLENSKMPVKALKAAKKKLDK